MYGWRGTIGLIAPSLNTVIEREFHAMAPDGVNICTSRILQQDEESREADAAMNSFVREAAHLLKTVHPDVVVYGCTSGGVLEGANYSQRLVSLIEDAAACKTLTVFDAILSALGWLSAKSVLLATPYPPETHKRVCDGFRERGVEIRGDYGLGLDHPYRIGLQSPESIYRSLKEAWQKTDRTADGIVISCTNFPVLSVIQLLEDDLGIPVVTSNQAAFHEALHSIRCDTSGMRAYGMLFRSTR